MVGYENTLNEADVALVFYSPEAIALKNLDEVSQEEILKAFGKKDLKVFTDPKGLENELRQMDLTNAVLLMMSSGNYGGLDVNSLQELI